MNDALYRIRIENRIAVVELTASVANGDRLVDLSYGLSEICGQIRDNEKIKVLVLTDTAENALSMGKEIIAAAVQLPEAAWEQTQLLADSFAALDRPVIAAIRGDAIGFGLELALACDIRIASTGSHFGLPHVKRGLLPWCGGSQRLPRIVGRGKALEMILFGEVVDAPTAKEAGLVCKVVPDTDLMAETMKMAETLAKKGPIAMGYIKEAVNKGMDLPLDQGLRLEADLYYLLHTTEDRTEGVKASRERRPPKFAGR